MLKLTPAQLAALQALCKKAAPQKSNVPQFYFYYVR